MRRFARLYLDLDGSTATGAKLHALQAYLADTARTAPADAAWAVYFLCGGKPRQVVPTALLRATACAQAGLPGWLFEACYQAVGDLAETIAHILPPPTRHSESGLAEWVEQRLLPLRGLPPAEQQARLATAWDELDSTGRFLLVKLIGGGWRVGVSKLLVQRALAEFAGLDAQLMAQRLVGWTDARATPSAAGFTALLAPADAAAPAPGQPYPFFLAHPLPVDPCAADESAAALGDAAGWLIEWKYDGMRAQLLKRAGQVWIWSRGEELVTDRFPEVAGLAAALPDGTVLDGELLVWHPGEPAPAPFQRLQQRITRRTLSRTLLAATPVSFIAYDLLEAAGQDLRGQPQHVRRSALEALFARHQGAGTDLDAPPDGPSLRLSPRLQADDWAGYAALRARSRERGVEGLMLKQRESRYGSGRSRADGLWWKWKVEPYTVDAVLIYAQAGHGRRAGVYTDYTFAVWNRPPADAAEAQAVAEAIARREPPPPRNSGALQLLPVAKAYSGLSDAEFKAVDRVIRATTLEHFGPVRSLRPTLLFEIGFEAIAPSPRHRSGVALRFPRMLRIREDKPLHEADCLPGLQALTQARRQEPPPTPSPDENDQGP
ncbi:cisplatin damage response ATP-dependent DNA ligase [Sphaerotilus microaerophilus]|uniref:ATP-dependent DNA ligase n=1 Tax=Sphaerotilus microaerophilus TaxID=2914710 RepID=A0ABN6PUU9_9BURK|nr:cisplatin damage response ATP-dependent DNA ligase [Sphaerotilus sp. FB-5]BDI07864.1 ATP-dependent DNA ligase [Sphaerotilus sp. FB-5]